ncbi:hypothetical protein G6F37_010545 [Rhizopus arrhizus]|nr:hypothetical protein G6F38_006804 [Rhizopus arrhizus]KAG1153226.1 hypothetical protein G6F37_010545 [Rhizopus arrhizus]
MNVTTNCNNETNKRFRVTTACNKKRGPQKGYAEDLEKRIERMEKLIQDVRSTEAKKQQGMISAELEKNKAIIRQRQRSENNKYTVHNDSTPTTVLNNLFQEFLDPKQCPPGIKQEPVQYLGELSPFQLLSNKIDFSTEKRWGNHTVKKFGEDSVLVYDAEPKIAVDQKRQMIPLIEWPEDIHPVCENIHRYIYSVAGIDKYTTVRLLKIYFANIHPILPLIDKTEFIDQYRGRLSTYPSGELLNAMFGAAARFVEHENLEAKGKPTSCVSWDVPVGWANGFFDRAEYLLNAMSSIPTLSKIQAILLILHHRTDMNVKCSEAWQMAGLAIRLALLLGLHRNCEKWDMSQREKETRKRVWWVLYITDVFQASIVGRSISLRDEDMNVDYPEVTADWEEVMDAYAVDKERLLNNEPFPRFPSLTLPLEISVAARGRPRIYELFLQFIKLSRVMSRILLGLHTPKAKKFSYEHGSDQIVAMMDHELTEWRYNFSSTIRNSQIPDFNQERGHFAPNVALILLHQPFLKKTVSKSSATSQQICSSAASRGLRIAHGLSIRDFLMCPYGFSVYPLRQFGLIQIFTAKNPNPQISFAGREDLMKGYAVAQKIKDMSLNAKLTHMLYDVLMIHMDHFEESKRKKKDSDKTNLYTTNEEPLVEQSRDQGNHNINNINTQAGFLQPSSIINTSQFYQSGICHYTPGTKEEAFSLSQFGFNTATSETGLLDNTLQNANVSEGYDILMGQQIVNDLGASNNIFRNDPSNLFWSLPTEFDVDALMTWLEGMNDIEWLPVNQVVGKCQGPVTALNTFKVISFNDLDRFGLLSLSVETTVLSLSVIVTAATWNRVVSLFTVYQATPS